MASLLQTKVKVEDLINKGSSREDILNFISSSGYTKQQIKDFKIDQKEGVSLFERFRMGLAPNKASKEKTMQKLYPESVKVGDNFAIYDDKTKGAKMFNPSGFDFGDVAEFGGRAMVSLAPNIYGAYKGQKVVPTPVGKVVGGLIGAGIGEMTGGETSDRIFQATGGEIDRTIPQYLANRGFDFALGSVSEFVTPYILKTLKKPFAGFKQSTREKSLNNIKIFEEANVSPSSLSVLSEGANLSLVRDLESILGNIPIAKDKLAKAGVKMQEDMGNSLMNTSSYLVTKPANVNSIKLGNIVKNGIENASTQFSTKSTSLYNEAFDLIKVSGDFTVTPNKFTSVLNDLATPSGANITKKVTKKMAKEDPSLTVGDTIVVGKKPSVLQSSQLIKLRQEINDKVADGTLTFADLRRYRSMIGKKLSNPNLVDDVATAEYKQLYGALSEDLKVILKDTDKLAYTKFLKADQYYKAGIKRIDEVLKPIKNVDQDKIVNYLLTSSQNGATYINGLKKSLKPDEFAYVQNAIIQKLGKLKAGDGVNFDTATYSELFNSNIFLTNWNKIDPKAKDFLFSSKKYQGLRKDLDRLAVIASKIAESGKTFENPSKTAGSVVGQLAYAGAITTGTLAGIQSVFTTGALLYGGAEIVTNPKIVKWLVQGTDIANNQGVDGFIKHLGKVGTVFGGTQPELQNWVAEYADTLTGQKDQKKEQ